jgi:uncharacterized protein YecE (DUF72 family)
MPQLRIGTSGYQYDHWKSIFYPKALPKSRWFQYYAGRFDTVEINNTFYRLPEAEVFESWRKAAPKGFCYALKFSRFATHVKRLKDPKEPLERFLQRAKKLKGMLGPILVQLPPRWDIRLDRLETFLNTAPAKFRWTVEFRDPRWLRREVYELLEKHNAALCIHDMIDNHPRPVTADWVYYRFHGVHYGGTYGAQDLRRSAQEIQAHLRRDRDVFAYFNNDAQGYAVQNAIDLKKCVLGR